MGKGEKERGQGGLLEWLGAVMPWLMPHVDRTKRTGRVSGTLRGEDFCQKYNFLCGFSELFLSLPNDPLGK